MHTQKPGFLIIGAQKCGTTWLHQQLSRHPGVFMPADKDLEFFSYQNHLTNPGFESYLQHFSPAPEGSLAGEATASYFWTDTQTCWSKLPAGFQRNIPKTIQHCLGKDLRLLLTLRNPVQRAVSAYLHYLAVDEIDAGTSFEQAMSYGGVIDMGFYAQHLRSWLEYYPLVQIKVLILESGIQAQPLETLAEVCRFLEIAEHDFTAETVQQPVFAGQRRVYNDKGVFIATDASATDDRRNQNYVDIDGQNWQQIFSAARLQQLNDIYRADVRQLDTILGTGLTQYWGLEQ